MFTDEFDCVADDPRTDWVAEGTRPHGQPGIVRLWSYPAVLDTEGTVWFWRDGEWFRTSQKVAASFESGPDWQAQCTHLHHGVPHIVCATEAECTSLQRGEPRDD